MRAESELVQRLIQKNTGMVACEWAPGTIRAVHARRKPDDQESRRIIAERRHRPAIIIRVFVFDVIKKPGKPGTRAAVPIEDRVLQLLARYLCSPAIRIATSMACS